MEDEAQRSSKASELLAKIALEIQNIRVKIEEEEEVQVVSMVEKSGPDIQSLDSNPEVNLQSKAYDHYKLNGQQIQEDFFDSRFSILIVSIESSYLKYTVDKIINVQSIVAGVIDNL